MANMVLSEFPTGRHAQALLRGEASGLVGSIAWTASRSALLALGMYLAGERKNVVKKAVVGSLAVEAMVIASVAAVGDVPSARAALSEDPLMILATYLARSSIVAGSLYLAGERDNLWRNSLAGCAVIEVAVLRWAKQQREERGFIPG